MLTANESQRADLDPNLEQQQHMAAAAPMLPTGGAAPIPPPPPLPAASAKQQLAAGASPAGVTPPPPPPASAPPNTPGQTVAPTGGMSIPPPPPMTPPPAPTPPAFRPHPGQDGAAEFYAQEAMMLQAQSPQANAQAPASGPRRQFSDLSPDEKIAYWQSQGVDFLAPGSTIGNQTLQTQADPAKGQALWDEIQGNMVLDRADQNEYALNGPEAYAEALKNAQGFADNIKGAGGMFSDEIPAGLSFGGPQGDTRQQFIDHQLKQNGWDVATGKRVAGYAGPSNEIAAGGWAGGPENAPEGFYNGNNWAGPDPNAPWQGPGSDPRNPQLGERYIQGGQEWDNMPDALAAQKAAQSGGLRDIAPRDNAPSSASPGSMPLGSAVPLGATGASGAPGSTGSAGVPGAGTTTPTYSAADTEIGSSILPNADPRLANLRSLLDSSASSLASVDRGKLSGDIFAQLSDASRPQYEADLRSAKRVAWGGGQGGSSMERDLYRNTFTTRQEQLDNLKRALTNDATSGSIADQFNKVSALSGLQGQAFGEGASERGELRGERAYSGSLEQQAFDRAIQQYLLEQADVNNRFNRGVTLTNVGGSGNPADFLTEFARQYGVDPSLIMALAGRVGQNSTTSSNTSTAPNTPPPPPPPPNPPPAPDQVTPNDRANV